MEYASKAVGNAALTTGIIGTALGGLSSAGGLAGILGIGPRTAPAAPADPGDHLVTRYELGLVQEINAKDNEIVKLQAEKYADGKATALQAQISEQAVFNATAVATMNGIAQQVTALQGITKLFVPNENVAPGWGPAAVRPFPPFPYPYPTMPIVQTQNTTSGGTGTDAANG